MLVCECTDVPHLSYCVDICESNIAIAIIQSLPLSLPFQSLTPVHPCKNVSTSLPLRLPLCLFTSSFLYLFVSLHLHFATSLIFYLSTSLFLYLDLYLFIS